MIALDNHGGIALRDDFTAPGCLSHLEILRNEYYLYQNTVERALLSKCRVGPSSRALVGRFDWVPSASCWRETRLTKNFKNHTKFVRHFIFFVLPVLIINFGTQVYWWINTGIHTASFLHCIIGSSYSWEYSTGRLFALSVQDA